MWAHSHGSSLMYKRMQSRDGTSPVDLEDDSDLLQDDMVQEPGDPPPIHSLPHVLVATIVSFLFGYHLGVVNEPLESISNDLGFNGSSLAEGLVVSTCLGGAFIGSLASGWIADGVGRRMAFQLCALPMIVGASCSAATNNLAGMLLGRFLVGIGLGIGPSVASLYITEVSPSSVRGTYGSFIQISTCLGLMGALLIGIPVKSISGWWRMCFWLSTIPAAILAIAMVFCAESPHWLYKSGRNAEAEVELLKLLGTAHVRSAMAELLRSDRGDENDTVTIAELLCGRHSRVVFIGSTLFALQQLSGINAVFYFSSTVFRSVGVSPNLANAFVGIVNLLGSIIALLLMDKLGRRVLLLWSFFGMVCLFICCWGWSCAWSPAIRNLSKPNKSKSYGFLYVGTLGLQFHGGITIPASARANGPTNVVLHVRCDLLDGSGLCKEKRNGNQRKVAARNRDRPFTTRIKQWRKPGSVLFDQNFTSHLVQVYCCIEQVSLILRNKSIRGRKFD